MSILDEADQLEAPNLISDLVSLPQFPMICIPNEEEALFDCVDDRLVSHLRWSEHARTEKYSDEHRYDVLGARGTRGLGEDDVDVPSASAVTSGDSDSGPKTDD